MSIRRLCVLISKCSWESLSLKGDFTTAYTFFSVGNGTGPETVAPVRVAVSTISLAAVSMAGWSYALRRMRILFSGVVAIACLVVRASERHEGRNLVCQARPSIRVVRRTRSLLDDLRHHAGADRAAALADGEAQARVHGDRLDQLDLHRDVVARHDHLHTLGQMRRAGDVRRAEVELRPVAREEGRVTATLLLLQDVDLGLELRVRRDRLGLAEHLAALDLLALGATQQAADVVARATLVEDLAEHLDTGDDRGRRLRVDADDLDLVARVDDALLDAPRRDRAAAGDREDVLDRHQERLFPVPLGARGVRRQPVR